MTDDDEGGYRDDDPETSKRAAKSFRPSAIMVEILQYLARMLTPKNGWEMSEALHYQTITVVPRLAPMRRRGLIEVVGTRPGPSDRSQMAYVITPKGRGILSDILSPRTGPDVARETSPPPPVDR
jgi:DNA-binding MarR family transcriptional regulator